MPALSCAGCGFPARNSNYFFKFQSESNMGTWGLGHWIVVLLIVVIVFGTKRLTGGAKDLGNAVKEFKKAVRDDDAKPAESKVTDPIQQAVDPTQPPADATRVQNPPVVAPGDDPRPRG